VSARQKKRAAPSPPGPTPADPADVVEGLPDRSSAPRLWKYLLLALIFVGWVCFLVVCQMTGNPK